MTWRAPDSATVTDKHHIGGQHGQQSVDVAALTCCQEQFGDLRASTRVGVESWSAVVDVAVGAVGELALVQRALMGL
ncbi:MAG: hypothetical protein QOE48_4986 [Mycobacterium sp.]|jgi:hypothetical protein|nr:hypothetical protein [Mycobacterium sp.]MDT7721838.1 hypothetical protein [Mycobacterium sp.]